MRIRIVAVAMVLSPVFADSAWAQAPRPAQVARPAVRAVPRFFVAVNGGYQITGNDFDDGATFTEHQEAGRFDTAYIVDAGPTFDIAGGRSVWRNVSAAAGITRYSRSTPTTLTASVPHPFQFNAARSVEGTVGGLKRSELAVHIQARALFPVERFQVMVFGGPSFFRVTQGMVTDFDYSESYPYDEAAFSRGVTTTVRKSKVGVHIGGDVAYYFTRELGIGFGLQYSGATAEIPSASAGTTTDVKAGGFQAGGGVRLRFR
jgi:hypothetical protein